jgi:hypothetical protein
MPSSLIVPKFATETEEADWWFDNQDLLLAEFKLAAAEGRLGRGTLKRRMEEAQRLRTSISDKN